MKMHRQSQLVTQALSIILFTTVLSADDWQDIETVNPQFASTEKDFIAGEAAKMNAAGFSGKPLYIKIREGLAKKVPVEALRRAIIRERENYEQAAQILATEQNISEANKMDVAQAIVIATKRGAHPRDLKNAISLNRGNNQAMIRVIDILGDFARSGIFGEKAVNAAMETTGRRFGTGAMVDRAENRADANRTILQYELRKDLPANKPESPRSPLGEPQHKTH